MIGSTVWRTYWDKRQAFPFNLWPVISSTVWITWQLIITYLLLTSPIYLHISSPYITVHKCPSTYSPDRSAYYIFWTEMNFPCTVSRHFLVEDWCTCALASGIPRHTFGCTVARATTLTKRRLEKQVCVTCVVRKLGQQFILEVGEIIILRSGPFVRGTQNEGIQYSQILIA